MKNRVFILMWKEFLMILKDRKIRISILLPPIIQLVIFTFAATLDVTHLSMAILNRDNGEKGIELVERFKRTPIFHSITFLSGLEQITPYIDLQKGVVVLSIDEQFSRNIDEGKGATLQLILDGRKSNTAQIVAGYIQEILDRFNRDIVLTPQKQVEPAVIVPRVWFNPNTLYYWYNIPCLVGLLSMVTCLVVTTQSIARERELGTFDQLLVSPISPREIVIGKIIPGIVTGLLEGLLMFVVSLWLFKAPFVGSFWLFLFSLLIFVTSISGIGLFISSLSKTQQQAMLGTFVFMLPSVLLSGFATPIENMPNWLQPVTYLIPLKYMLVLAKGIFLKDLPFRIAWINLWPLLLIASFNVLGASFFFRKRLG